MEYSLSSRVSLPHRLLITGEPETFGGSANLSVRERGMKKFQFHSLCVSDEQSTDQTGSACSMPIPFIASECAFPDPLSCLHRNDIFSCSRPLHYCVDPVVRVDRLRHQFGRK